MKPTSSSRILSGALLLGLTPGASAADPTAEQALKLAPIQKNVEYDRPAEKDLAKCSIKPDKEGTASGWAVFGPAGEPLRRFLDTNNDGQVDQWCYFKDGLEVYRDIDADFNLKADQYRWFNTAGTRWGVDDKEDRTIDEWRAISAEEVTQEVALAVANGDEGRFAALLLSQEELSALGLGDAKRQEISTRLEGALDAFRRLATSQKLLTAESRWSDFGSTRPGVVPAGTQESTKDLVVYENVSAVVETRGKHEHLLVGTLIQVGASWRIIDAPQFLSTKGDLAATGIFFRAAPPTPPEIAAPKIDENVRKIVLEIQTIDKQLAEAAPAQQDQLNARRCELLEELIERSATAEERAQWTRQLADTVSLAVQMGTFGDGLKKLEGLIDSLEKGSDKDLAAYARYRYMTADYSVRLQEPEADIAKVQATWIESLTAFAKDFAASPDAPDAMLQLAIALESSGKEDDAAKWYGTIVADHPTSAAAKKAGGAKSRLESVGKKIALRGRTVDGKTFDLSALAGRVVLIHYWASYSEPCLEDLKPIRQLYAKYGQLGFLPVGVCLDHDSQALAAQLKRDPLPWPQLFETGGLENNRLASEMGIITLPVMILVDKNGAVVNRNVHSSELEAELKKLLKTEAAAKPPARPAATKRK